MSFQFFTNLGMGLIGIVIIVLFLIITFWYIFLPLFTLIGIYYYYNKKIKHEKEIKERRIREEPERIRQEQDRIQRELHEQRQKKQRINFRLKLFNLSEREAELIFGKHWRKILGKHDWDFATEEINRLLEKLCNLSNTQHKFSTVMDKVLDLIKYYIQWLALQRGWIDVEMEEKWEKIKQVWEQRNNSYNSSNYQQESNGQDFSDPKDYYQILGVPRTFTIKKIKITYRKLIMRYHPDKNPSKDAEEKCKKINEAYEVLSDSKKRETYDKHGFIFE